MVGGTSAGSDSIYITFSTGGTVVPASITAANVKVNGTACSSVSVLTSGSNGKIAVVVPSGMTLPASTQATVTIDTAARLQNGPSAGTYTVIVETSTEFVSSVQTGNLTLAATASLTITQVTPSPTTVNGSPSFTIKFTTGSSGALSIGNTIVITFPTNTSIPASIDKSLITVNGTNPTVNATASGQALTITTPVTVGNIANVTIAIGSSAGILNPMLVSTTLTLTVSTTAEAAATSSQYSTTATTTTVTTPTVTPSVYTPSTAGVTYTVVFNTGTNGRLLGGTSTITITFAAGTTFGTLTDSVNGVLGGTPTTSGQAVTFTVPASVNIGNSGLVTVKILGITNPVAGNYTVTAKTSVETGAVTSTSYPISNVAAVSAITVSFATANTDTVNMSGGYSVQFTVSQALTVNVGTITITFPAGTTVPASIAGSNVTVSVGTPTAASIVTTNSGTRTVTITTPVAISNVQSPIVTFATAAGIVNPSDSGSYDLDVNTSAQPTPASSPIYTIKATRTKINNLSVSTLSQKATNVALQWTWVFTTGLRGKLVSGSSQIFLKYDSTKIILPSSITASLVDVNNTAATTVTTQGDSLVIITVPSTVTIGNQTTVTIVIDSGANIRASADPVRVSAYTSVEVLETAPLLDISLPVELAFFAAQQSLEGVDLSWRTESEVENAYWILERAENHEDMELSFEHLTQLKGQGTKSFATDYTYKDLNTEAGKMYSYRLGDVAYNGTITYHEIRTIAVTIPKKFELHANYPNPFNPTTKIVFALPQSANVEIAIYNVLGQRVKTLVSKNYPVGVHALIWNGRNERNSTVGSGIYIYRMTSKGQNGKVFAQSRKMLLLK